MEEEKTLNKSQENVSEKSDKRPGGIIDFTGVVGEQGLKANKAVSLKNKKIGKYLILAPFVGVVIGLIGVVVIQVISTLLMLTPGVVSVGSVVVNFVKWIFMLIGIVSVVGLVVCVPIGIIFLSKREITDDIEYDERSGNGKKSIVPQEIKGWNWGAAGLTWIWGISQSVWISLLSFIPIINIFMWIVLGIKGNEWAWRKQKWENVDEFLSYQKKWKPWGILFFSLSVLGLLMRILSAK